MYMSQYDFEEERIRQEIARLEASRVLIQLPEGLKPEGPRLAKIVEKTDALPIISADSCYGACDLATAQAKSLDVDLIIHYGHSKLLRHEPIPTIYVEARATVKAEDAVEKALSLLERWRKIGLTTTIQHVQTLDNAREILLHAGKTVIIGDTGNGKYPGQVIGCDYTNAKSIICEVDAFLFIGGGRFHALGVALSTSKPTIIADPYENRAFPIGKEAMKIFKQRWASIEKAKQAQTFAILVGLKLGQTRLDKAIDIKKRLEKRGKPAHLFAVTNITPLILMNYPAIDAYVNTACPRLSLDDFSKFQKPVLTINETLVMLDEVSWEELCEKGLLESQI